MWHVYHNKPLTTARNAKWGHNSKYYKHCFTKEEFVMRECKFAVQVWKYLVPMPYFSHFNAANLVDWIT